MSQAEKVAWDQLPIGRHPSSFVQFSKRYFVQNSSAGTVVILINFYTSYNCVLLVCLTIYYLLDSPLRSSLGKVCL